MPAQTNQSPAPLTKKQRKEMRRQEKLAKREKIRSRKQRIRVLGWIALIAVLAIGVLSLLYFTKNQTEPDSAAPISSEPMPIQPSDHSAGNKESKTILIEYSDFQCPACGAYYSTLKQLKNELGDSFAFIYRHFPLPQHQNAELAAQSAEAAAKQGKFWEMHDKLFENQSSWSPVSQKDAEKSFADYAESLGLDINQFKEDAESAEVKKKIADDKKSGERALVNATPSFFLNGVLISPKNYDEFKQLILESAKTTTDRQETNSNNGNSTDQPATETEQATSSTEK
jgi:protein-disulfide isomerase